MMRLPELVAAAVGAAGMADAALTAALLRLLQEIGSFPLPASAAP